MTVKIKPVTNNKAVWYLKTAIIRFADYFAALRFVEQGDNLH